MKLDRYVPGRRPKYRVINMQTGADVDPADCFVLKRRDANAPMTLMAYANEAARNGDRELAGDVERLAGDWIAYTKARGDGKMPD